MDNAWKLRMGSRADVELHSRLLPRLSIARPPGAWVDRAATRLAISGKTPGDSKDFGQHAEPTQSEDLMQLETLRKSCSMRALSMALAAVGLSAGIAGQAIAADDVAITPFSTAAPGEPPASWKFATLPNKVATKYSIVELSGARALKVEADESYGNLVHNVKAQVNDHSVLTWSWRVDKLVEEADLKVRAGEDSAAKLCVFFAFDVTKL
jgi:hypothetical protein